MWKEVKTSERQKEDAPVPSSLCSFAIFCSLHFSPLAHLNQNSKKLQKWAELAVNRSNSLG